MAKKYMKCMKIIAKGLWRFDGILCAPIESILSLYELEMQNDDVFLL